MKTIGYAKMSGIVTILATLLWIILPKISSFTLVPSTVTTSCIATCFDYRTLLTVNLSWPKERDSRRKQLIQLNAQPENQEDLVANSPKISFELEFGDRPEDRVTVELSSIHDIPQKAHRLASRFGSRYNIEDIERILQQSWESAKSNTTRLSAPPAYDGPIPSLDYPWSPKGTIELPSGLVLQLGPSTLGEGTGLGVFVRLSSSNTGPVLQTQGSAFCGYGPCEIMTDSLDGLTLYQRQRTFEFNLPDSLESYVWFDGRLQTIWDVMKVTTATEIRGHRLERTENDELTILSDPSSPCYLIPPAEQPSLESLDIQRIGQMCNDLAGGLRRTEEEYDYLSDRNNLLVLVPRIILRNNKILEPNGMPILTMAKTIMVSNVDEPMEVGLRYGQSYWENQ